MKKSLAFAPTALSVIAAGALPVIALASTNNSDFDLVWAQIADWAQGGLGKVIAGSMILVGLVAGVARQSLMAFAAGIGGGIGLFYFPDILDNTLTATLPLV